MRWSVLLPLLISTISLFYGWTEAMQRILRHGGGDGDGGGGGGGGGGDQAESLFLIICSVHFYTRPEYASWHL